MLSEIRAKWFISKVKEFEGKGVTQVEIAKALGVVPQYLTPLLSGKRGVSDKIVSKFCKAFNISQNDLLVALNKATIGLMSDDEIAAQDAEVAAGTVQVGESPPPAVANHPSYLRLLDLVQEQAAEVARLKDEVKEVKEREKSLLATNKSLAEAMAAEKNDLSAVAGCAARRAVAAGY